MIQADDLRCSTLMLDVHWASRAAPDEVLARHLSSCERCASYLAHLDAIAAARPANVLALPPARLKPSEGGRAWREREVRRPWAWALAGALVLAGAVGLVLLKSRERASEVYVASKGSPAVQLIVRRGDRSTIWDGHAPVRPRDVLALRAACEGFERVSVAAVRSPDGVWERLADAKCLSNPSDPLPLTLVVDDQPGGEHLAVVLSRTSPDEATLQAAARRTLRNGALWTVRFDLPKAMGAR